MALPNVVTEQHDLLTLNTNKLPFIKNAILDGVDVKPLFLDAQNGIWVLLATFAPGVTLPMHFHTGTVHAWTLSGLWHYLEYPDQPQTAGCYLYEPGGSVHQFHTPESNTEDTTFFMVVTGANVDFDANAEFQGIMDAGAIEAMLLKLAAEQGLGTPRYIRSRGAAFSTD
jgi:2,4'-dihydroxyacetophenone dioxygenase